MTFTLVAHCPDSGQFGLVICSSSPAVAARCAHARAGVGAVASQNITDPALGCRGLDLLAAGASAAEALAALLDSTPYSAYRQLALVDAQGGARTFSGRHALGIHATAETAHAAAAGNLLSHDAVPQVMLAAYQAASGAALPDRLLAALQAAGQAGGEAGPVHSAGLLVVDRLSWPVIDLRIDWQELDPIGALQQLWRRYQPQQADYVRRAVNPAEAPAFGVAGDP